MEKGSEKKSKGIQIGKEKIKLYLISYDMTVYVENYKSSTKTSWNYLRSKARLQDTMSIYKSQFFPYTSNEQLKFKIKKKKTPCLTDQRKRNTKYKSDKAHAGPVY